MAPFNIVHRNTKRIWQRDAFLHRNYFCRLWATIKQNAALRYKVLYQKKKEKKIFTIKTYTYIIPYTDERAKKEKNKPHKAYRLLRVLRNIWRIIKHRWGVLLQEFLETRKLRRHHYTKTILCNIFRIEILFIFQRNSLNKTDVA